MVTAGTGLQEGSKHLLKIPLLHHDLKPEQLQVQRGKRGVTSPLWSVLMRSSLLLSSSPAAACCPRAVCRDVLSSSTCSGTRHTCEMMSVAAAVCRSAMEAELTAALTCVCSSSLLCVRSSKTSETFFFSACCLSSSSWEAKGGGHL